MKSKKILIIITLLLILFSVNSFTENKIKLRDHTFNAIVRYDFINPEGRAAAAIIYFNENKSFEYRETAGRGTAIFIGNYSINKNMITFKNDNNITRNFNFKLTKKSLFLNTLNFNRRSSILFHIQPVAPNQKIKYLRINRKSLNFRKSKKIEATYFLKQGVNVFALVLSKNNEITYKAMIKGKEHVILIGKYSLINNRLVIEDKKGIRFRFHAKINENKLSLKHISNKFLIPFYNQRKELTFIKI